MPKLFRILIQFSIGYLFLVFTLRLVAQDAPDHPWIAQFEDTPYPLVVAHADDSGTSPWPGDTLLFLENAQALGVDVLEMNVHRSLDGEIVLIHDETVDDTTEGTGLVREMTLAELQALDAAYDWTQDGGQTFPYRGQGIRIPALASVFETFPESPMIVEIKQTTPLMGADLCSLIRTYAMETRVIVASFSDEVIRDFRSACPEVATASAGNEVRQFVFLNLAFLTNPVAPGYFAFQVPVESGGITVINRRFVDAAHRQNLEVHAWTINDPDEMQQMIDFGVDAIMTDRPDVLLDLLGR